VNAKTAKLLRRLAGLSSPRDGDRQLRHLKARYRGRLRVNLREAIRQEIARRRRCKS
jgi:hypothetical protein